MENSFEVLLKIYEKKMNYENEKLDFKEIFNFNNERDKLEILKDLVSFANTNGGYIVYGVTNSYEWIGLDADRSSEIDDIKIIDFSRKYIDAPLEFKCGTYDLNGNTFYLITIEKHNGELISFTKDGNYSSTSLTKKKEIKTVFKAYSQYGRVGSSSKPINNDKLFKKRRNNENNIVSNLDQVMIPYVNYIDRPEEKNKLIERLNQKNIRNVQINGLGGIGKTSFIRNFCEELITKKILLDEGVDFIVWITGKMTLFLDSGETKIIRDAEITYEEVLCEIGKVFQIDSYDYTEFEGKILEILSLYNSILIFDNMETINDNKILKFLAKIPPSKTRIIFTTRENMNDLQYARIDLDGFKKEQFEEYLEKQIRYFDSKNAIDIKDIKRNFGTIYSSVQGSPIMANMIAYKICQGMNMSNLLRQLNDKSVKNKTTYDKAMEFCFEEVFSSLDLLEKEIMFILSIPDSNEEYFTIPDIMMCTNADENLVVEKMMKLYKLSFCSLKNGQYSSQNLVKLFSNKKLSSDNEIDVDTLKSKYSELKREKEKLGVMSNTFYSNANAYTYDEKNAALQMKATIDEYEITGNLEETYKKINKLEEEYPNFAYIYFRRALFEKELESSSEVVRKYFEKAISLNQSNDHYYTEYAFYLEKINKVDAVQKFKNAIELNNENRSAHHGLALCYVKMYNNKEEFKTMKDVILNEFKAGYSKIDNYYWNKHNINNYHAHSTYLKNIGELNEALRVCQEGIQKYPHASMLYTLEGNIKLAIDPNYINPERIKEVRRGVFSNASDEVLKDLIKQTNYKSKKRY